MTTPELPADTDTLPDTPLIEDPVDETPGRRTGALLLDQVVDRLNRFAVLPSPYVADALALYIGMTQMRLPNGQQAGTTAPRCLLLSDEHGTGKSTVGQLMSLLVANGHMAGDVSEWSVVRDIAERNRTLLLDNFDTKIGRGSGPRLLLSVLLTGFYRHTATVGRGKEDAEEMPVFAPIIITARGRKMRVNTELNPGLFERGLVVEMVRARPDQVVDEFDWEDAEHVGGMARLNSALGRWGRKVAGEYVRMKPELPDGCINRRRDVWRPLFRVADLAGGDWPERARRAFRAIVLGKVDDADPDSLATLSPAELTLVEVRYVFDMMGAASMSTVDLLSLLEELPGTRWSTDPDRVHSCAKVLANDLKAVAAAEGLELDRGSCKVAANDGTGRFVSGYWRREIDRITPSGLPVFRSSGPSAHDDDPPLF